MIISYYFTSAPDPQGRVSINRSDPAYIQAWYDSVVKHGLKPVLFHDGITTDFINHFPELKTIQVPPVPLRMQLHDYHWVISHNYLIRHKEIENLFFTDCPDCEVINNPFIQEGYDSTKLYCADEPETITESKWIQHCLKNPVWANMEGFAEILASNEALYNGGVLGGGRDIVLKFTGLISELVEQVKFRINDGTGDMALYNYILHKHFNPVHGFPVNSVFKAYENRNDVWFKHK